MNARTRLAVLLAAFAPAAAGANAGVATVALAASLAAAPKAGTVFTVDGGRLKGTILDTGPGGVSVQLADGATRNIPAAQVTRVDFSDGTSWTPNAPQPTAAAVPTAASATAAPPGAQAPRASPIVLPIDRLDSVYLANGGRVRGLVVEDIPSEGVLMRLVDGSERRYRPGEVVLVQYADGTISPQPKGGK